MQVSKKGTIFVLTYKLSLEVCFEKIECFTGKYVTFYAAKFSKNELNEFELFDAKEFPDHAKELKLIYNALDIISEDGIADHYFVFEGRADAMPRVKNAIKKANKKDFGLRLYCIRLTEKILILGNGDIKTKKDPEDCKNVDTHFFNIQKIADKLLRNVNPNIYREDGYLDDLIIEI